MTIKVALCLFAYRPYGGLQRDFLQIAQACVRRGYSVSVWTMEWQGAINKELNVEVIPVRRLRNHAKSKAFAREVKKRAHGFDVVVGFNRIPGLDIYYAADPCYVAKIQRTKSCLFRLTARYRHFAAFERAVFNPMASTHILMLSEREIENYIHYYQTPAERFTLLPPGIGQDRRIKDDSGDIRRALRAEFNIPEDAFLVLLLGSGFKTKGLDRAMRAMAALPAALLKQSHLLVVGDDRQQPFMRLAERLRIADRVIFAGGRPDVPRFLAAADILIHPAYSENTGTALLEAMVSGLPVLVTDVCGYAPHITRANAGEVIPSPFEQHRLNTALLAMSEQATRARFAANGRRYGETEDLYSMPERAVDFIERYAGMSL